MKKVIITGSTGMVGKGVLLECLDHPKIEKVLVINRSNLKLLHPKLEEIRLKNFTQVAKIADRLLGYDACFHCMGVSSIGLNEKEYDQITFGATSVLVEQLYRLNPEMVFNYVSGAGTDSSEKGKSMWARVKGKTENKVLNQGFKDAYAFRPGAILPEKGIKSKTGWYNAIYFVMRPFFTYFKKSKNITTTTKVGLAMINTLFYPQALKFLENKDINTLADKV